MGDEKVKAVHDCNSAGLNMPLSSVSHSMASASCCSALMDGIRCISVSNNLVCCDVVSSKEQTSTSEIARIRTCGLRPMNAKMTLLDMRNESKPTTRNRRFLVFCSKMSPLQRALVWTACAPPVLWRCAVDLDEARSHNVMCA